MHRKSSEGDLIDVRPDMTVALQAHAVCRRTTSGLTMLFDRAKGVMYELNESASAIVELLSEEPQEIKKIVQALADDFDAPSEEIQADVDDFIRDFAAADLLELDGQGTAG